MRNTTTMSKLEKEFVPYEQALELNELGFNEECFAFHDYYRKGVPLKIYDSQSDCSGEPAPLYQQAFRWFREKHNLFSHIVRDKGLNEGKIKYIGIYHKISERGNSPQNTCISHDTYEEAELECLKKLIEIVKTNP
jgi:hypothetical protein